jgi:DNA polymerase-3 subunit beta
MIATVEKSQLNSALGAISQVVNGRTMAILSNVLLVSKDDKLELTGSNGDVTITTSISAVTEGEWSLAVPPDRLRAMVGAMSDGEIALSPDARFKLHIASGETEMKLSGMDAAEFPPLPQMVASNSAVLKQNELRKLIKRTEYAISDDKTRPMIMGLLMLSEPSECAEQHDILLGVGVSGHRVSTQRVKLEMPVNPFSFVVPVESIRILNRLLEDQDIDAEISITPNMAQFLIATKCGIVRFITKLSAMEFPKVWRNAMLANPKIKLILPREQMINTLTRAELVESDTSIGTHFFLDHNQLRIQAGGSHIGECNEALDIRHDGEPAKICMRAEYALDVLNNLSADDVEFGMIDEYHQAGFYGDGFDGIVQVIRTAQPAISAQPEPTPA